MTLHDTTALSPTLVAAVDDLELAARGVVDGLRVGSHRSPFHGYGAEFQQHRPYRAGDDLKYLDWKVYGRSNRLYTRQFRETTNVSVMLVLDTSASMDFVSIATPADTTRAMSKFRYAVLVAASLAYLAIEQGNAVGLMSMADDALVYLPARSGRVHLRALLARLDALRPTGRWQAATVIQRAAELLRRRGLMVVLSDFYDDGEDTTRELRHVVQRGHDVAMLQVLTPDEQQLPAGSAMELEELETGRRQIVQPEVAAARYSHAMSAFLEERLAFAVHEGIDYTLFDTGVAPERALRDYLVRRSTQR